MNFDQAHIELKKYLRVNGHKFKFVRKDISVKINLDGEIESETPSNFTILVHTRTPVEKMEKYPTFFNGWDVIVELYYIMYSECQHSRCDEVLDFNVRWKPEDSIEKILCDKHIVRHLEMIDQALVDKITKIEAPN